MNYFKKGLLVAVVLMLYVGTSSAIFWKELEKHNPQRIEAIRSLKNTIDAAQYKSASPELKQFANNLISNMAPYSANSLEWEAVLNYFDMVIEEYRRHPIDFCELLKDREECIRLFKSRVSFFLDMGNVPGADLIPFLKEHPKRTK